MSRRQLSIRTSSALRNARFARQLCLRAGCTKKVPLAACGPQPSLRYAVAVALKTTRLTALSRGPSMSSSPLRSFVKPSYLIMLSVAWGAMVTGTNAFASPTVGPQELKNQFHSSQENSFTHISCSRDQFNKCVKFCIDSQLHTRGTYSLPGCKRYCSEAASTQNGCP
jgi:hypothetical protein